MSRHCFKHLIGISSISDHDFIYWALYQSFNMHDVILSSNHPNKVGTFIKPPLEIRKVKCGEVKWWGSHGKWEGKAGLEAGTMWHQGLNHFVKVSSNVVLRVVTQPPAYVWWHTFNSRCYDQRFCWTWLSLCPLGRLVCKLLYACELRSWWDPPANVAEGGSQLWTAWSIYMYTMLVCSWKNLERYSRSWNMVGKSSFLSHFVPLLKNFICFSIIWICYEHVFALVIKKPKQI